MAVVIASSRTEQDIEQFRFRVAEIGAAASVPVPDPARMAELPAPVQRYFAFTFRGPLPVYKVMRMESAGDFRRPLTKGFNHTTSEQILAIGTPALMFSATTPVLPGLWARAYDYFADGEMEMKAKLLSTFSVMNQAGTPELNRISLRRWLLESALFPQSLLPGGPVSWEPIDSDSARAVVELDGVRATMTAHFDAEGRMTHMTAEEEGDLTTPYHGSGEHVTREDYQAIGDQMIPMRFTISRFAAGKIHPFYKARITSIDFE